jgi:hypothetical protein
VVLDGRPGIVQQQLFEGGVAVRSLRDAIELGDVDARAQQKVNVAAVRLDDFDGGSLRKL